jgi:hypothetical protein
MTDQFGAFLLTGVAAGRCTVRVHVPGFDPRDFVVDVREGQTSEVDFAFGDSIGETSRPGELGPGKVDTTWVRSLKKFGVLGVYRIAGRGSDTGRSLGRWPVSRAVEPPSAAWTDSLHALLLDPWSTARYGSPSVKKLCEPYPTYIARFATPGEPTDVLVCLGCDEIWFSGRTKRPIAHIDRNRARFVSLADAAFPNDPEIARLKRP